MRALPEPGAALAAAALLGVLAAGAAASGCVASGGRGGEAESGRSVRDEMIGPDEDENGIRDDVDEWIGQTYEGKQEEAVRQFARAMTEKMIIAATSEDEEKILDSVRKGLDGIDCMFARFDDVDAAGEAVTKTRARIVNTYARSKAAGVADDVAGGHVFGDTKSEEEACK